MVNRRDFFLVNLGPSPRGSLTPAAKGGKFPLSHYTRSWRAKLVIRMLLSLQGITENCWMAPGALGLSGGQAWLSPRSAGACHGNDGVAAARFMDGWALIIPSFPAPLLGSIQTFLS